ncbi:Peroxisomal N(1)-acetyl-spermine/spermidine oxidase [Collichthys lucidus]|uniref:Peroxisomal N(1)-acetyl-spermine/spermidine oxidase n=1 Tax=Collichthys lucidus TaxID=240159 RepID=A0A4U5VBV0_COLLU|nr:Peroxisomal N(1)-acetyl-spermine/spermidine oxidase [Collichthys lucidus]
MWDSRVRFKWQVSAERKSSHNRVNAKIVIVGCGISGIAAAHRLVKAGFHHVRIVEATARSGGRIKTGRLGDNIIEIGANWIHGPSEENPVFCLARQYGLLDPEALTPENQAMDIGGHPPWVPNVFTSSGRKLNIEDVAPAVEMFAELLEESSEFQSQGGEPYASMGDFIRSEVRRQAAEKWKDVDAAALSTRLHVVSNLLKVECCVNGSHSMDDVGLGAFGLYKTLPGLDCTFPGGYEGLIKNLMTELPGGLVTYNQPVHCVHWSNTEKRENPVVIECEAGERITADHVIVTVPLGYLKKHHSTLFRPPLPLHKLHSVQRLGFGTNNKIFVEFDSPWWDADCEVIYYLWEDEDAMVDQVPDIQRSWIKKLFGFTVLKPTERYGHVLCGWIAGHESEYMETLSEQEVMQGVTQLIRRFTGNPTITPRRILRSQWFHDPWTCGSYTYPGRGCSLQDLENMMEPLPTKTSQAQVLFAGEATHPCYYSTVHGALLSGWREADRLISHYSSISPSELPSMKRRRLLLSPPLLPTITETLEDLPVHPSSSQSTQSSQSLEDYMTSIQALARPVEAPSCGPVRLQRSTRPRLFSKAPMKLSVSASLPRTLRTSRLYSLSLNSTEDFSLKMGREKDCRGKDPVDWLFGQIRT